MNDNTFISAVVMIAVMLGAGMFIIEPFFRKKSADLYRDEFAETPLYDLLSRKDSIYAGIKDLEFDYSTGKLSEGDYKGLRAKLSGQAAEVLEEIDALKGKGDKGKKKAKGKSAKVNKCGACGFASQEGDKFCQSCGSALA